VKALRFIINNNKQKNFCIGYYTHHSFSVTLFILGSRLFYSDVIKSSTSKRILKEESFEALSYELYGSSSPPVPA
jgi:hypothetical protein